MAGELIVSADHTTAVCFLQSRTFLSFDVSLARRLLAPFFLFFFPQGVPTKDSNGQIPEKL